MRILITGAGGREHVLGWKISQNPAVEKIYFSPGNGGTAQIGENIGAKSIPELLEFAKQNDITLTIGGSEDILVDGITDAFAKEGLKVFGPHSAAAQLEGSKVFAKDFMQKHGIKTAAYGNFSSYDKAWAYAQEVGAPLVVKASGLAAGKGVLICPTLDDVQSALETVMVDKKFGDSGDEVVIEEFLEGFECSILSIYNGKEIYPMKTAKDHKKIGEGETGLNTGGMGVVSPNPLFTDEHFQTYIDQIQEPTRKGLEAEGLQFAGVIFFGLMITQKGVYLLEYNIRFGDPEAQTVLPLLKNDLGQILIDAVDGKPLDMQWEDKHACCVVMVAGGYPEAYEKGNVITGLDDLDCNHFVAGAQLKNNTLQTSGGRVLNIVAQGDTLEEAQNTAYANIKKVQFKDSHYRTDIGKC